MQASGMLARSAPVTSSGMLWSSGLSLWTSVTAVFCEGTVRSSWFHNSLLIEMMGGVSPTTMSREKETMWSSSAVLLA